MSLFDFVNFGPADVKAVADGTAGRGTMLAVLTSQTCGEACWHAREEICRCSCGGRNHGCLSHGDERPERTSKIDGHLYRLAAVGRRNDIYPQAAEINRLAGYRYIDKPRLVIGCASQAWTEAEIEAARMAGKEMWWNQYYQTWSETDSGAPARLKYPSASQRKWSELTGWKDERDVCLLWVRVQMPDRPNQLKVGRDGKPLESQIPKA